MKNLLIISFIWILHISSVFAQVKVKYFNERFVWVEVPTQFVKARLNYPVDGYSVCWIEVVTPKETFDFVLRRGWPYKNCLARMLAVRDLLKKNNTVEIIGNAGSREKQGSYFTMWELIRGKSGCEGYFGGCKEFEKDVPEWNDWKSKPINPKLYP